MHQYSCIIVDDEIWALTYLQKLFDRPDLGFHVIAALQDATRAVQSILHLEPDFVLTDIRMPNMTGLELAQALRRQGSEAGVVVISAFSDFEYAQCAIREGVIDYVTKPVTEQKAQDLISRLRERDTCDAAVEPRIDDGAFEKLLDFVREHFSEHIQLSALAKQFFLSESYLSALFRTRLGTTFTGYVLQLRLQKAARLLSTTNMPIKAVSEAAGYADCLYFSKLFKKNYRLTPMEYRRAHAPER